MKKIVVRSFTLFLALSLTLPASPALALRDEAIAEEHLQALTGLEEALKTPPLPTPPTAGLEETGPAAIVNWGQLQILTAQFLDELLNLKQPLVVNVEQTPGLVRVRIHSSDDPEIRFQFQRDILKERLEMGVRGGSLYNRSLEELSKQYLLSLRSSPDMVVRPIPAGVEKGVAEFSVIPPDHQNTTYFNRGFLSGSDITGVWEQQLKKAMGRLLSAPSVAARATGAGLEEQALGLPTVEPRVDMNIVNLAKEMMDQLNLIRSTVFPVGTDQDRAVVTIVDTTTDEEGNPSPERAVLLPYLPAGTIAIVRSRDDLLAAEALADRVSGAMVITLNEIPGGTEAERFQESMKQITSWIGMTPDLRIQILSGRQPAEIGPALQGFRVEYIAPATLPRMLEALRAGEDIVALFESEPYQRLRDNWDALAEYL